MRVLVAAAGLDWLALESVRVGAFVMSRRMPKGGHMKPQLSDKGFQQPWTPRQVVAK